MNLLAIKTFFPMSWVTNNTWSAAKHNTGNVCSFPAQNVDTLTQFSAAYRYAHTGLCVDTAWYNDTRLLSPQSFRLKTIPQHIRMHVHSYLQTRPGHSTSQSAGLTIRTGLGIQGSHRAHVRTQKCCKGVLYCQRKKANNDGLQPESHTEFTGWKREHRDPLLAIARQSPIQVLTQPNAA